MSNWTPLYKADFTKLVVRQLLALVQRDIQDALDSISDAPGEFEPFHTYQLSPLAMPQFPAILIVPQRSIFDQLSVGTSHSVTHYYVAVGVDHADPNALAEKIEDYVRAVDYVLTALPIPDFYTSWPLTMSKKVPTVQTTALVPGTVKEMFVMSHAYDEMRRLNNKWAMVATLDLLVEREEA